MSLLWIIVGALLLLLLWDRRREGLEKQPSNHNGLGLEEQPPSSLYDYTTTCEECVASGKFWGKIKKVCIPTEQEGFEKSCV
jgi:hypothetical protein